MTTSAGSVIVKVGVDDQQFDRGMKRVDKKLDNFEKLSKFAFKAGAVAATGFGAAIIGAVKAAGNFEQSLNVFQSVSKASAVQMKAVSDQAKRLGADMSLPATSAKDAADAMLELSKGGLSVAQTMDAARGVLQLSAAATIDNATAATIVARALKSFGLAGTDASRVADVLANAANASTGEITDFALGLQQSSAVARLTGLTLNETTAALMQLADAGIVGSDAGTSLKTMLQALIPTSERQSNAMKKLGVDVFDASGKFVGIQATIGQYSGALKDLSKEQQITALKTIFGSDAVRAAAIVLGQGSAAYGDYLRKTELSGTASAVAAAKMKGFNGAVAGLKSVVETLAIEIGSKALPALTELVNRFSRWIGNAENAERVQRAATSAVEAAGNIARTVWPIIERLAGALSAVAKAVGGWGPAFAIVTSGVLASKLIGLASAFGMGGGVAGQAALATGKLGGLRAALLLLPKSTVIAVVVKTILDSVGQSELPTKIWNKTFGKIPYLGDLGNQPSDAVVAADRAAARGAGGGTFGPGGFTGALDKLMPAKPSAGGSILGPGAVPSTFDVSRVLSGIRNLTTSGGGGGGGASGGGGGGGGGGGSSAADTLAAAKKEAAELLQAARTASADRLQEMYQASIDARNLKQSEAASLLTAVQEYEGNLAATQRMAAADRLQDQWQASIDARAAKQSEAAMILRAVSEHEATIKAAQVAAVKARLDAMLAVVNEKRALFAASFGRIANTGLRAFDAMTAAFRTPGESALASIRERRQQEDAAQSVADAETRLAQVRANTESTAVEIANAERALARAREDITIRSLETTAAAERTDYEARRENLRISLEDRLTQIREHFTVEGGTVAGLTKSITDTLAKYGVDFTTVGGRLGTSFIDGLVASISAAGQVAAAVTAAVTAAAGVTRAKPAPARSGFYGGYNIIPLAHGGIVKASPGGTIARIGEAGRDEAVIPLPRNGGLGGNQTVVNINVSGSLIHERDLEDVIARAAQAWSRRNGPLLSRTAGATA